VQEFLDKATEAFKKFGNNFRIGNEMDTHLEKAGFTNISVRKLKVPIGPWPKVITCTVIETSQGTLS
jgi:hypothetical protein